MRVECLIILLYPKFKQSKELDSIMFDNQKILTKDKYILIYVGLTNFYRLGKPKQNRANKAF